MGYVDQPLQLLITTIEYDNFVGRIAIGKIARGKVKANQNAVLCKRDGSMQNVRVVKLYSFIGLNRVEIEEASMGDIVAVSGMDEINIGETIADTLNPEALPFVDIEEPTISMNFIVNNSPFAGKEGDFVTSRHLRARLFKELETNVAMRVFETDSPDSFEVAGRGELHLSILIETMRRQGFEFQISKPSVIFKEVNGEKLEPIEHLTIDIPEEYVGAVMDKLGTRKAEMINMTTTTDGYLRLEFKIPARGLIGYRSQFMTDTKGNGVIHHTFDSYESFRGEIPERQRGSLISFETGETSTYGLFNAESRGLLFIGPGVSVYEGMIVGENAKQGDIEVNVCRKKHVTNMRSSGTDEAMRLITPVDMSLENCLEFIAADELVEVTPKSIRLRKRILDNNLRAKSNRK